MFYVYVLQSLKDDKLYTGFTNNLQKRILKHNLGKVFSTKSRQPLKLIYVEICLNQKDAKQKEKYLKTGSGKTLIKQRLKYYFKDYYK
ncbi:MAG: excinuclease ABC subunit C [Candidatus Nealsonbacteria bacterium RBG_13_36_15]|uniref:Excinuclease ABC subunit C n=1 Tax=Candidatus Nealsonbacteria bacterium RBG_13_36_15 TaxID=1801660 RepID=A0A1G2DXL3_9BACT|nr:MAG: excinuclease ABC subunit C [Candidatus Nealsonbacteria bacterium RBG_13_36_15]